ncbi:MAG: hypothetical protein IPL40_00545 [Proteobacteria bacterium]|nr:hypothetical protein [Pseudomonadota bacterium]
MSRLPRIAALFLVGVAGAGLAPALSSATVMPRMSLRDLVGSAERIFVGTALSATAQWSEDGRFIVTDTIVRVDQALDGSAGGGTVVVRELGGSVDGIGMRVAGSTELPAGRQLLLFTRRASAGRLRVVGMRQGAYLLAQNARGRTVAQRSLEGLTLRPTTPAGPAATTTSPSTRAAAAAGSSELLLDTFVAQVRETVTACAKTTDRCRPAWARRPAAE